MPKLCSNDVQMQTRLHMSCIEIDDLLCNWGYDAPKMGWTHKSCAGLDSDISSEKRSNLSYWIYTALFVLSLNETQKNYTWGIVITRYTRNYPSHTIQFFVKVLLHSVVQEASVRIGIKGSWRLWFCKWVLYFHRMLHIIYQVLEVLWPLTLSAKIRGHVTWVVCY